MQVTKDVKKQLSLLIDVFGEDNAKYQEKEIEVEQRKLRRIVPNIAQIIPCNCDMYAVFNDDDGESINARY